MKIKLQISLFFFLLVKVCAEAQTFNKLDILDNDYFTNTGGIHSFLDKNQGNIYTLFGGIHRTDKSYQGVGVCQHDSNGELLNYVFYFDSVFTAPGRNLILLNDTFYYFDVEVSSRKTYLNIRDKELTSHERVWIQTNNAIITRPNIFIDKEKIFLIGGAFKNRFVSDDGRGLILEISKSGEVLMERIYIIPSTNHLHFSSIAKDTVRERFVLCGISSDNQTVGTVVLEYTYNWHLITFHKIPAEFKAGGYPQLHLTNSSVLIAAPYGVGISQSSNYMMPAAYEMDFNGNIIWEFKETHGSIYNGSGMRDIHLTEDGMLYALAFHETYFDTTLHENWPVPYFDVTKQAVLYKWNAQRELVYTRHIKHWSTASFMSDSEPMRFHVYPDGSVLITGQVIPDFGTDVIYKQQLWFVKTDTNGCVAGEPCIEGRLLNAPLVESKSAIPEQILYPNPSYHGRLYSKVATQEGDFAEVYTISGQKMATVLFQNNSIQLPSHIANGYYIIKMNLKDQIHATKIMLQR